MARDFDLTSPKWLDIVFAGKNHEYGAYVMRRDSSDRHLWALVIMIVVGAALMFLPGLIKSAMPQKTAEDLGQTQSVTLVDLEQEIPEEHIIEQPEYVPPPPLLKETIRFTPPVITDEEVNEEDMMLTQQELTDSKVDISVANIDGTKDGVDIADVIDNKVIVQVEPENKVLDFAEQMPRYPDGDAALYKWLGDNLVYPAIATERGTQGTVVVKFVVLPSGKIGEVRVYRGVDRDLDNEAVRVVKKLPDFIPGRQNGQAVSVWFTLPVQFRLQ